MSLNFLLELNNWPKISCCSISDNKFTEYQTVCVNNSWHLNCICPMVEWPSQHASGCSTTRLYVQALLHWIIQYIYIFFFWNVFLLSKRMFKLMKWIFVYSCVIVDTPPSNQSEWIRICCCIVVIEFDYTNTKTIKFF